MGGRLPGSGEEAAQGAGGPGCPCPAKGSRESRSVFRGDWDELRSTSTRDGKRFASADRTRKPTPGFHVLS